MVNSDFTGTLFDSHRRHHPALSPKMGTIPGTVTPEDQERIYQFEDELKIVL